MILDEEAIDSGAVVEFVGGETGADFEAVSEPDCAGEAAEEGLVVVFVSSGMASASADIPARIPDLGSRYTASTCGVDGSIVKIFEAPDAAL